MVYVSWSAMQLAVVLITLTIAFVVSTIVLSKYKQSVYIKHAALAWVGLILLTMIFAIDTGTRQSNLNRTKFNATLNESVIEKVESGRLTVDSVKSQFDNSLKKDIEK